MSRQDPVVDFGLRPEPGPLRRVLDTAAGDMLYASTSSVLAKLGIGSAGEVLAVSAGLPSWEPAGTPGAHTLADTSGLGASQTTSGLSAGQVLRATAATTAAFQSLIASDIPSLAASKITAGTFGAGDYVFPADVTTSASFVSTGGGATGKFLTGGAGATVFAFSGANFDIRAGDGMQSSQNVLRVASTGAFDFQSNAVSMGALTATTGTFSGNMLIGTTTPATASPKLDVVGDDIVMASNVTDASTKAARFAGRHYTNAEQPMALISG
ncbi:hypothetical protein LCGC14_2118840, partial [marine sediment metagenome]